MGAAAAAVFEANERGVTYEDGLYPPCGTFCYYLHTTTYNVLLGIYFVQTGPWRAQPI